MKVPCSKLVLKYGMSFRLAEVATLRYLAKRTKVPIPRVYCAFKERNVTYILMEWIDGEPIRTGWENRSQSERKRLLEQLRDYIDIFRNLPHPLRSLPGAVGAVDMQQAFDFRTFKGELGFGPFAKEADFNNFLRFGVQLDYDILHKGKSWISSPDVDELQKLVKMQDQETRKICFTHGDLNGWSIIVKKGKIVALIDFETSGFFPEYWEYTTAIATNRRHEVWKKEIPNFLVTYPRELDKETIRLKHFGRRGFQGAYSWW